ncbi:GP46-like surface antigen, putative [Bodo saltans]|uniref:GP46-like surface antigen, putative n=1 Tax=Bodo saltans TaxID=75058 RepID=A0A0S4IL46_BODSA|nr:GP46-like surface antigen, putative [Bodo saltans]|eukprot:CUF20981.1 GP46-like surface antigen, putative [Bodo saltans]
MLLLLSLLSFFVATSFSSSGGAHGSAPTNVEVDTLNEFDAVHYQYTTRATVDDLCNAWRTQVICNANNSNIVKLNFTARSLVGTLPASLSRLPMLAELILAANSISGTLPPECSAWGSGATIL